MHSNLIYDVGLHDGSDTRHYLESGFRVVAVEANPVFVAAAHVQFAQELADGQLVIVDAAVAAHRGDASFWVNDENSEWSSLLEWEGARYGTQAHQITVACVTFDTVLAEHGVPFYLKIDIERASEHCLAALSPPDLPTYVSIEAHTAGYLGMLSRLGYDEFKLIDQRTFQTIDGYEPETRRTRRAARNRAIIGAHVERIRVKTEQGIRRVPGVRIAHALAVNRRRSVPERTGARRPFGASGPFAEHTGGEWRPLDEVAFDYLSLRFRSPANPAWYDFHARLRPEPIPPSTSPT